MKQAGTTYLGVFQTSIKSTQNGGITNVCKNMQAINET